MTAEALASPSREKAPGPDECRSREDFHWHMMPFAIHKDGRCVDHWAPPNIEDDEQARGYAAQCLAGNVYALEVVGHLRQHADVGAETRLSDVVEAMVKHGQWTGFEIGFFHALGHWIARGEVPIGMNMTARVDCPGEVK